MDFSFKQTSQSEPARHESRLLSELYIRLKFRNKNKKQALSHSHPAWSTRSPPLEHCAFELLTGFASEVKGSVWQMLGGSWGWGWGAGMKGLPDVEHEDKSWPDVCSAECWAPAFHDLQKMIYIPSVGHG